METGKPRTEKGVAMNVRWCLCIAVAPMLLLAACSAPSPRQEVSGDIESVAAPEMTESPESSHPEDVVPAEPAPETPDDADSEWSSPAQDGGAEAALGDLSPETSPKSSETSAIPAPTGP